VRNIIRNGNAKVDAVMMLVVVIINVNIWMVNITNIIKHLKKDNSTWKKDEWIMTTIHGILRK